MKSNLVQCPLCGGLNFHDFQLFFDPRDHDEIMGRINLHIKWGKIKQSALAHRKKVASRPQYFKNGEFSALSG